MFATARACLKKAFRELRVPVCGRFYPNEGGVSGYRYQGMVVDKAKGGVQISEMIFQTRSKTQKSTSGPMRGISTYFFLSSRGSGPASIYNTSFPNFKFAQKAFSEHSLCHDKKPKFKFIIKPSTTVCQFLYKFSSLIYNSERCLFF